MQFKINRNLIILKRLNKKSIKKLCKTKLLNSLLDKFNQNRPQNSKVVKFLNHKNQQMPYLNSKAKR